MEVKIYNSYIIISRTDSEITYKEKNTDPVTGNLNVTLQLLDLTSLDTTTTNTTDTTDT